MRRFQPKLIPTLFTIPTLILTLALGVWQVQRLHWKQDLIDTLQERAALAPVPLPEGPLTEEAHEFIPVTVSGRFDHAHEFTLLNRSLNGKPGVNVVTPLIMESGEAILINRGWVPFELQDLELRREGQVPGEVTITGLLRFVKPQSWIQEQVVPPNEPENNAWFTLDTARMAEIAGLSSLPVYYILSGERDVPGGYPVGRQWRVDIRNNHLEYAITWFSMAISLSVIYVIYHWRRPEELEEPEEPEEDKAEGSAA